MAAEGPKSQRLAGRVADGAVVNGPHPSIVRRAVERVTAGAAEAGRDIDDIEIWIKTRANVAPDHDTAVEAIEMTLADYAAVRLKSGIENKDVPARYESPLQRFIEEFESHAGSVHNQELLDQLELTEFFADRYGIVGTPSECVEQLQALSEIDGVTGVWMSTVQRQQFIDRMAESVLPELE
jgi:alkanesulfonate monooxygenase SsuD/methylene tetrahydromethanopterin reductase-like flavin-dependent oxidoreductase (luciferase family)